MLQTDLVDDNKIDELDLVALCEQWLAPCYKCSAADIYNDGKIDFKDYAVLANNWLKPWPLVGDITGNGTVDADDLKVLVFHWLKNCDEFRTMSKEMLQNYGLYMTCDTRTPRALVVFFVSFRAKIMYNESFSF